MAAIFPPVAGDSRIAYKGATTASGSTINLVCSDLSTYATDYFNNMIVSILTGAAKKTARVIIDFDTSGLLTLSPALPAAPGTAVTFEIIADISQNATIEADIGDASADGFDLWTGVKNLYLLADATLASVTTDSLIGHILAIDGDASTFNDNTDSLEAIGTKTDLIDAVAVNGLAGVVDSLAYRVHEIENHLHSREYWYGKGSETGFFLATAATGWQMAAAGTINEQGLAIQLSDGTEVESGNANKYYDLHEIYVKAASVQNKIYRIRFHYGTAATFSDSAVLTEILCMRNSEIDSFPKELQAPRITCNNKLWCDVACETGSGTIDILIGLHSYTG